MLKVTIALGLVIASAATAAPVPGEESGLVSGDGEEASTGTQIARGVLWVPKGIFELVTWPLRGATWLYDRYQINDLWYRLFYFHHHELSVLPSLEYSTGLGLTGGLRFESRDTFGDHEYLTVGASYGGTHRFRSDASIDSGVRLDPVLIRIGGNVDRFDPLPFYGIGNQDLGARPAAPVDPTALAFHSDYRYEEARADLYADWRLFDDLHVAALGTYTSIKASPTSTNRSLEDVYDPAMLTGFDQTRDHLYGQAEVRWDRRRILRYPWETTEYTTGYLVRGFAGRVHQLDEGTDFTHYGVDLQAFVHLATGPQMLVFRIWGEGVTGSREEVPFYELPYLGGDFLRGYDFARFRDRLAGVGSAEYVWNLSRFADAFVFVDAGRVYSTFDALTLKDLRVGYGAGLMLHSLDAFVVSGTLASSIDGGIVVTASFSPLWNATPRWR